jgi:hypothetical protein
MEEAGGFCLIAEANNLQAGNDSITSGHRNPRFDMVYATDGEICILIVFSNGCLNHLTGGELVSRPFFPERHKPPIVSTGRIILFYLRPSNEWRESDIPLLNLCHPPRRTYRSNQIILAGKVASEPHSHD